MFAILSGYCLPNGYQKIKIIEHFVLEEVQRLAKGLSELGVSKIRLTGGELLEKISLILLKF